MKKKFYRSFVILGLILFTLVSLPVQVGEKLRSVAVASLSPSWRGLLAVKLKLINLLAMANFSAAPAMDSMEVECLLQENQALRTQLESVREWLLFEDRIEEQLERLKSTASRLDDEPFWKEFFKRRCAHLSQMLDLQLQSLPAKVIFREPESWSSSIWINVGEKDNDTLGRICVAKNSPVLLGTSIVGVVEEVGRRQSRVRLITDSSLVPAVRAVRGAQQDHYLIEHVEAVLFALELRDDLLSSEIEAQNLFQALLTLKNHLTRTAGDRYLAKGELCGCSNPLWRSRSQVLKGFGFNYDYPDAEGPSRDLRTGEAIEGTKRGPAVPILKPGDLLVTSGLDGVFPPGFQVAVVSKIQQLREGGAAYELEAKATAGNFDEFTHVFVLPPLNPLR